MTSKKIRLQINLFFQLVHSPLLLPQILLLLLFDKCRNNSFVNLLHYVVVNNKNFQIKIKL